jgi:hypothetical protein
MEKRKKAAGALLGCSKASQGSLWCNGNSNIRKKAFNKNALAFKTLIHKRPYGSFWGVFGVVVNWCRAKKLFVSDLYFAGDRIGRKMFF